MNRYEDVRPISRIEAEKALSGGSVEAMCDALVRIAFHDPDWLWIQTKCLEAIAHPSPDVRGLAATCLGHLARIHRRLDRGKVLPALESLKADPELAGRAEDALEDIETFLGPKCSGEPSRRRSPPSS